MVLAVIAAAMWVVVRNDDGGSSRSRSSNPSTTGIGSTVAFSSLPAFKGVDFADDLQADQKQYLAGLRQVDVGGLSAEDYQGPYTNVESDVRETVDPSCKCPEVTMWLTGGSAAFGLAQRDEHTVASELVRLAAADGIRLRVENMGVPGRTLWNEYQALQARLEQDPDAAPDVVVSYGVFNDAVGALSAAAVGSTDPNEPNLLDSDNMAEWKERGWELPDGLTIDDTAELAADRYMRVQALVADLANDHGAIARFVAHPDALASPRQFAPVADVYAGVPATIADEVGTQLDLMNRRLQGSVIDLRHLHDDEPSSLFADWAHVNERGASLAAEALYAEIGDDLVGIAEKR